MKNCTIAVLLFLSFSTLPLLAQLPSQQQSVSALAVHAKTPGWFRFRPEVSVSNTTLFTAYREAFGLGSNNEMRLIRSETDQSGMHHHRFQQYYNGIPVEGAEYLVHEKNGRAVSANGRIINGLNLAATPSVSSEKSIAIALSTINAKNYLWEDAGTEALLKRIKNDRSATFYPEPELVIVDLTFSGRPEHYRLAWKLKIFAMEPLTGEALYIDAKTAEVIHSISLIHTGDVPGTAVTKYSGSKTIMVDSVDTNYFRLRETSRAAGVETYDLNRAITYGSAIDFVDSNNIWNNVNTEQDEGATDGHWGAEVSYDYFFQKHGRDSYDNKGSALISFVHFSVNYVNAFWNGTFMTYGDGNGTYKMLTSLDICAHELTHGVTQFSAGLVYSYESGALNESFSDIFGVAVDFFARPTQANWLMADEIGSPFRSMSDPKAYGDPDTYKGINWATGSADYGGVHTNSGVQNKWFYLLVNGGNDTNDVGTIYNVTGIGMDKAAQIAYRNLTVYLSSYSQYLDARQGAIWAAEDLFGVCSPEAIQTANAWHAVGVGDPVSNNDVGLLELQTVSSGCGLNAAESVKALFRYNGCDTLPSGDTVFVSYLLDSIVTVTDTVVLSASWNPGDSLLHVFTKGADLSLTGWHRFDAWIRHNGDTLNFNDSIIALKVESKLAQNFDVGITALTAPRSGCNLTASENVKMSIKANVCDSLNAAARIPVAYRINGGTVIRDTLNLSTKMLPGDSVIFTFSQPADLSSKGTYRIEGWTEYQQDTIRSNDTLLKYTVTNPLSPEWKVVTFEDSAGVMDSLYIVKNIQSDVFVSTVAKKGSAYGLMMTGGNWLDYRRSYARITDLNTWTANPKFLAEACFCVDAASWSKLYFHFDLKQTFNSGYGNQIGYSYPYTSNLRLVINGTPLPKTYNPKNRNTDPFVTYSIDLNAYKGSNVTACFQTKNYQARKYDPIGDNAFIENVYFSDDSAGTIGFQDPASFNGSFEVYPNPSEGNFSVTYVTEQSGKDRMEITDITGRIIYSQAVMSAAGTNHFTINVLNTEAGIYYLRFIRSGGTAVQKIILTK